MNTDIEYAIIFFVLTLLWYFSWKKTREKYYSQLASITGVITVWSIISYLMFTFHLPEKIRLLNDQLFRFSLVLGLILVFALYYHSIKKQK